MNYLKFLLQVLVHLVKVLAYQWIFDAGDILKRFIESVRNWLAYQRIPHADRGDKVPDCTNIDNPAFHRPDPCIYSQDYLLKLGLPVTWDNPDILLRQGGVQVPEHALQPDTEYEIEATVWNNSYEAPAVGLKVLFSFLAFGIGTVSTAIGTTFVTLGVKGGVNHPALAKMLWRTPAAPGHYCLQVLLEWIDDANPANNLGQNNLDVVVPQSPAEFSFRLRNSTGKPRTYGFEVDCYTIPEPEVCKTSIGPEDRGRLAERVRRIKLRHNRSAFPVPAGWTVDIQPAQPALPPDAEIDVAVKITPPTGFAGRQPFNVNALYDDVYTGGVSLIVSSA